MLTIQGSLYAVMVHSWSVEIAPDDGDDRDGCVQSFLSASSPIAMVVAAL